jgi:hypothetical protein
VSITLLRRAVLAVALLAAVFACGQFALAGSTSLEDLLAGALAPSATPALLGPITSAGRVGWECKPERAAAAARWHEGELPTNPSTQ